jgi:hypothetical protein
MDEIIRQLEEQKNIALHLMRTSTSNTAPHFYEGMADGLSIAVSAIKRYIADQSPDLAKPPADGEVLPEAVDNGG